MPEEKQDQAPVMIERVKEPVLATHITPNPGLGMLPFRIVVMEMGHTIRLDEKRTYSTHLEVVNPEGSFHKTSLIYGHYDLTWEQALSDFGERCLRYAAELCSKEALANANK